MVTTETKMHIFDLKTSDKWTCLLMIPVTPWIFIDLISDENQSKNTTEGRRNL